MAHFLLTVQHLWDVVWILYCYFKVIYSVSYEWLKSEYYYYYFLTLVLNSQGMKKLRCAIQKVQKSS